MKALVVFLCIFSVSLVFGETQEALFERALDAENQGDVPATIALLEEASRYQGPYNAEIQEILGEYYAALQIKEKPQKKFSGDFLAKVEGAVFNYQEYGDVSSVNEYSGENYLLVGGRLKYRTLSGLTHSWIFSFSTDLFFREKETVFDTSRWAFIPSAEYNLQGDQFAFGASVDMNISERDGLVPAGSLFAELDFFQGKNSYCGLFVGSYGNILGRARIQSNLYWDYSPVLGFRFYSALGPRFERDTVVNSYIMQITRNEFTATEDTAMVHFYTGRSAKLGPELRLQTGYKFSKAWSMNLSTMLFYGWGLKKDFWLAYSQDEFMPEDSLDTTVYYQRQVLQGYWVLRGDWSGDILGAYLSFGQHFTRYMDLPADHPELLSKASILSELRLGFSFRF
jgi:hypothetical protein